MKVRLNLSTSPLESNRRFTLSASVVGTIAVVALLALSYRTISVWRSDKVMRRRSGARRREGVLRPALSTSGCRRSTWELLAP